MPKEGESGLQQTGSRNCPEVDKNVGSSTKVDGSDRGNGEVVQRTSLWKACTARGNRELAAAHRTLEGTSAERVAVENAAMAADRLAIRLGLETAEDRVGFLFVNLDEVLDGHVPAFRGHKSRWPSWYFTPPRLSAVIVVKKRHGSGRFSFGGTRGVGVHVQAPDTMVLDTHDDAAASGGCPNQCPMRIRLNMGGPLVGLAVGQTRQLLHHISVMMALVAILPPSHCPSDRSGRYIA